MMGLEVARGLVCQVAIASGKTFGHGDVLPQPSETAEAVKKTYIDANQQRVKFADMTIIEITGSMLRAARSLAGLSQQEIAGRARISRPSLTTWENSSSSVPSANTRA